MSKNRIDPLDRIADSLDRLCATLTEVLDEARIQYAEEHEQDVQFIEEDELRRRYGKQG